MKSKRGIDCSCPFFSKEDGGCLTTNECLLNQKPTVTKEKITTWVFEDVSPKFSQYSIDYLFRIFPKLIERLGFKVVKN